MKKMIGVLFILFVCTTLYGMEDQEEFLKNSVKEIAAAINRRCKGDQAEVRDDCLVLHDKYEQEIVKKWLEKIAAWDDEFADFEDVQSILDTDKEQNAALRLSSSGSSVNIIFKIVFCSYVKKYVIKKLLTEEDPKDQKYLKKYPFLIHTLFEKKQINSEAKKMGFKLIELYPRCEQIIKYPFVLEYEQDSIKAQLMFYAKLLAEYYLDVISKPNISKQIYRLTSLFK